MSETSRNQDHSRVSGPPAKNDPNTLEATPKGAAQEKVYHKTGRELKFSDRPMTNEEIREFVNRFGIEALVTMSESDDMIVTPIDFGRPEPGFLFCITELTDIIIVIWNSTLTLKERVKCLQTT